MSSAVRRFRVAEGRRVVFPRGVVVGPGATNLAYAGGELVDLPAGAVDRFVRNRIRLGDLVEVAISTATLREGSPR